MNGHVLFCWHMQKPAIVEFMHRIGATVSRTSPCPIFEPTQLAGLEHISFLHVKGHAHPVPQLVWDRLRERGFVAIEIDDQDCLQVFPHRACLIYCGDDRCDCEANPRLPMRAHDSDRSEQCQPSPKS